MQCHDTQNAELHLLKSKWGFGGDVIEFKIHLNLTLNKSLM